jgi:hypothetical protein
MKNGRVKRKKVMAPILLKITHLKLGGNHICSDANAKIFIVKLIQLIIGNN